MSHGHKTAEVPLAVREIIIRKWKEGLSCRQIEQDLGTNYSTVSRIIKRYKETSSIQNKNGRGRKPILSPREKRIVLREVQSNRRVSALELKSNVKEYFGKDCSSQTIRNAVHEQGFKGRVARPKPFLSRRNKVKRLKFAKQHVNEPESFWNSILWSDESKFKVFASDGRQMVWRKPHEAFNKHCLNPTIKYGGGSVMVWGCMSSAGVGKLHFINGIMDRFMYRDILNANLYQSAAKLGIVDNFLFQQDNDPKHTSKLIHEYLTENGIQRLQTPPQSPDLNPIEHLWSEIKSRLKKFKNLNSNVLKMRISEIWENIASDVTRNLVDSMKSRLQAVIVAKGGNTKY